MECSALRTRQELQSIKDRESEKRGPGKLQLTELYWEREDNSDSRVEKLRPRAGLEIKNPVHMRPKECSKTGNA